LVDKFNFGNQIFDFGLTVRYRYQGVDEFNGSVLPNTGGRFLFLTPGVTYYLTPKLSLNMSGDVPLYTHVDGTQLAPSYRFNIGLFLVINRKKGIVSEIN
jgi:hypothetical protein